jgi:hypothetical protein
MAAPFSGGSAVASLSHRRLTQGPLSVICQLVLRVSPESSPAAGFLCLRGDGAQRACIRIPDIYTKPQPGGPEAVVCGRHGTIFKARRGLRGGGAQVLC